MCVCGSHTKFQQFLFRAGHYMCVSINVAWNFRRKLLIRNPQYIFDYGQKEIEIRVGPQMLTAQISAEYKE